MASKTVTLYIDQDVIDKLEQFSAATHRSKSGAAEVLILHGIANYDVKAAAPRKMAVKKKPTAANTRVKTPAEVKVPRGLKPATDAAKPGRKPKAAAKPATDVETPKRRGRPPKAKAAPVTAAGKPAKRRGRPPKSAKPEAQEAA